MHTNIITLYGNILHYYLHGKLGDRRSCKKFPVLCFKNDEVSKGTATVMLHTGCSFAQLCISVEHEIQNLHCQVQQGCFP